MAHVSLLAIYYLFVVGKVDYFSCQRHSLLSLSDRQSIVMLFHLLISSNQLIVNRMIYRGATSSDLVGIERLLRTCRLPSDDIADHVQNFVIAEVADEIIGVGGLQVCGSEGLIRSIVIATDYRGKVVAEKLYRILEARARAMDFNALYLLTESAEGYFTRFGFTVVERDDVPRTIAETQQYRTLCPSSATVMMLSL